MRHNIKSVKNKYSQIRYIDDKVVLSQNSFHVNENSTIDEFYNTSVCINHKLTPIHEVIIQQVCDNLNIQRDSILAFINSSPEVNAYCREISNDRCLVNFTSSLVNLLSPEEFAFVAGHEIGHFIFQHSELSEENKTPELFMRLRAQEISSDRIGFLCCKNINTAISALVKIASGLNNNYLNLDIKEFLSQAENLSSDNNSLHIYNTHPTVLIRAKSILWFSMNALDIKKNLSDSDITSIRNIDIKIKNDIDKFLDNAYKNNLSDLENKYKLWFSTSYVLRDNIFDKKEQDVYKKTFGNDKLAEIKNFISQSSKSDVKIIIDRNLENIKSQIFNLNSSSFEDRISRLEKSSLKYFI